MNIEPYRGFGQIKFGMTRAEIRSVLGEFKSFMKQYSDKVPTDAFDHYGAHVYYDPQDRCVAVELFSPAVPTLHEREILGVPYEGIESWFTSLDPGLEITGDGFTSPLFGLSVYAPMKQKAPAEPIEGVYLFDRAARA